MMELPLSFAGPEQLIQQVMSQIHFPIRDIQGRRHGQDILAVATYIQHQSQSLPLAFQMAIESALEYPIRKFPIGCEPVGLANLDSQRHAHSINIANLRMFGLKGL